VAQVLERRVAAVVGTRAEPGRHPQRVHERHAEDSRIEVDRHPHVVGVEREVVDAAGERRRGVPGAGMGRGAHARSPVSPPIIPQRRSDVIIDASSMYS
jgi:hypothetical protein